VRHYPGQARRQEKAKAELLHVIFQGVLGKIESGMPFCSGYVGYDAASPPRVENEWSSTSGACPRHQRQLPDHTRRRGPRHSD